MRIAYLFTSFPKTSERFLQRELTGLDEFTGLEVDIHSMLGGKESAFGRFSVQNFSIRDWLSLPFRLCSELIRDPAAFHEMARLNDAHPPRCWINCLEHYLGMGFAIVRAHQFRCAPPDQFHAVWATGPASAALFLSLLTKIPFSMGCHAYDLFRRGGDALLEKKLGEARFIHTTTVQALTAIEQRGAPSGKTLLIRRSHSEVNVPALTRTIPEKPRAPLRILSVGRLIEKKGYFSFLEILHFFKSRGLPIEARIIGDGPLRLDLQRAIERKGLEGIVELFGAGPYDIVQQHYRTWADVFFFTGTVAASGDRDGLPNVILEAMTNCVPVFATPAGGVAETIIPGETGELLPPNKPELWWGALRRVMDDPEYANTLRKNARSWVVAQCDPRQNAERLEALFRSPPIPK
ncbi:MAG: glycosyltransferase [Verrucomicrobia bacterium]|jgi:glycosyltransferase involved in cell wall biosynthesis|nr:glycosyltransferase [Verrucomicrobiota bacterium]